MSLASWERYNGYWGLISVLLEVLESEASMSKWQGSPESAPGCFRFAEGKTDHRSVRRGGEVFPDPRLVPAMPVIFTPLLWNASLGGKREWYPGYCFFFFLSLSCSCCHEEIEKGWVLAFLAPKGGLHWSLEIIWDSFTFQRKFQTKYLDFKILLLHSGITDSQALSLTPTQHWIPLKTYQQNELGSAWTSSVIGHSFLPPK